MLYMYKALIVWPAVLITCLEDLLMSQNLMSVRNGPQVM